MSEDHWPIDFKGRAVCTCGDFNCASLVNVCVAAYGKNEDLCYQTGGHKGAHSNRWGTTWAR